MSQAGPSGGGGGSGGTKFPITPFVVGPVGQAGYQTIQSALDAAAADSGMVWVQPGGYAENLTFPPFVNVFGAGNNLVNIAGTHSLPITGATIYKDIDFSSNTDVFSSTEAGAGVVEIDNCTFEIDNGYILNIPNWQGQINLNFCISQGGGDNFLNATSSSTININSCILGNNSPGTALAEDSTINATNSIFNCPFSMGSSLFVKDCTFNFPIETTSDFQFTDCIFNATVTTSDIGVGGFFNFCYWNTPSSLAYDMNANGTLITFSDCVIDCQIHPVMSGNGNTPIQLTDVSFVDNSQIDPALVVQYGVTLTGTELTRGGRAIKVTTITNAISPYLVASTDEFIACDGVGGAITIDLPNGSFWPVSGTEVRVCDSTGNAAINNITIDGNGKQISYAGVLAATIVMVSPYQLVTLTYNGSFWNGV